MIYVTGIYPENLSTGVIVPIYKKGDNEWAEESNFHSQVQFAYKSEYSTTDAIFVLHAVLSSSLESFNGA